MYIYSLLDKLGLPVEEPIGRFCHELNALCHDGQQGEGCPHLVLAHQLRHNRVGDLLNGPVEGIQEAFEEDVGE